MAAEPQGGIDQNAARLRQGGGEQSDDPIDHHRDVGGGAHTQLPARVSKINTNARAHEEVSEKPITINPSRTS